jgi:hypothetical protein
MPTNKFIIISHDAKLSSIKFKKSTRDLKTEHGAATRVLFLNKAQNKESFTY